MKYHCYIVPFYMKKNMIKVLIGKKLTYNKKDGYIHNNPGQFVYIGGGCKKKDKDRLILTSLREFKEETGHSTNQYHNFNLKVFEDYSVLFYKVDKRHYNLYKKINKIEYDQKYKEIQYIQWVDIEKVSNIFNPKLNNNIPFTSIDKYIQTCINRKIKIDSFIKRYKMTEYRYFEILREMNNRDSIYYKIFYDYIKKVIIKKSCYNWYYNITSYLKKNIMFL
jgi:hypothetical protein